MFNTLYYYHVSPIGLNNVNTDQQVENDDVVSSVSSAKPSSICQSVLRVTWISLSFLLEGVHV